MIRGCACSTPLGSPLAKEEGGNAQYGNDQYSNCHADASFCTRG